MPRKNGPWTILSSRTAYQNPWFKLREDAVIQPNGQRSVHAVIEGYGGANVLPMDKEGYVYLANEFKYALGRRDFNAACGGINPKETPLQAAKRELKEELGITAKKWIKLGITHCYTSISDSASYLFLAQDLSFGQAEHESTESIQLRKIKFNQVVKMALNDKITHAPTVMAILKAREYLLKFAPRYSL